MDYKYLIFDLDQTLYPKQSGLLQAIDARIDLYIKEKLGISGAKIQEIRHQYWVKYGTTVGGMILHHQIDPTDYFRFTYDIDVADYLQPDPELGRALRGIDLPKLVFSNSPQEYVERVLDILGIRKYFAGIYDILFCDCLGKPNPSSYQRILEALRVSGPECIFVDDVAVNVIGAQRVGMTPILLGNEPVNGIDWSIGRIIDIEKLIPEIIRKRLSA